MEGSFTTRRPSSPRPSSPVPPSPSLTGRRGRNPYGVVLGGGSPLPVREGGRGGRGARGEGSSYRGSRSEIARRIPSARARLKRPPSKRLRKAATTRGQNWLPVLARTSAAARSGGRPTR